MVLDGYLRLEDLAKEIGISPRTLSRWQLQRIGPPRVKVGKQIFYKVAAVQAWLESRPESADGRNRRR